jgi:hypothetical protein
MKLICPTCEIEVNTLVSDVDGSTEHVCQFHGSVTPRENTAGEFRGYDDEGHRVVVGWNNGDGSEYLVGLTKCCGAAATCDEDGDIVCKKCYHPVSWTLAMEAEIRVPA